MHQETEYFLSQNLGTLKPQDVPVLQGVIRFHRAKYYDENISLISDKQFDTLFTLLSQAEEKFGIHDPASPTQKVHESVSVQFKKELHMTPMKSLDNTYDAEDLKDFEGRIWNILTKELDVTTQIEYFVELKFDGLGIALTYEDGKLVRWVTRWDGTEGENITINVMQIANIPKTIPFQDKIEIRGEVVMPILAFQKLNQTRQEAGENLFANPRNAASGSLRQLDWNITKERGLEFYAYSAPLLEERISTYADVLYTFKDWGFAITPFSQICVGIDEVLMLVHKLGKKPSYPFEIDGLVIKVNPLNLWNILGFTAHHPRYAIAYKFPAEYERTQVLRILHSVGRTGTVTPVAEVTPVEVSGVVVRNATLHNYDEVARKDIRVGDFVYIHRAGEVIPEIISPIPELRTGAEEIIMPPSLCPICQTPLVQEGEKVAWICLNSSCPAKVSGWLEWFIGKHGLNIDGFWPERLMLFQRLGWVWDFASIFDLRDHKAEMLHLPSFQEKSVTNLLESIEKARKSPLVDLLASLGILWVGKKTASLIAPLFQSKEDIIHFSKTLEELVAIDWIGEVTASEIVNFFSSQKSLLQRLVDRMEIIFETRTPTSSKLSHMSFCVTGSFENFSRDKIHEIVIENGGKVLWAVSKNLTYLIAWESAGSKLAKATSLGVKIISLDEFLQMASGGL